MPAMNKDTVTSQDPGNDMVPPAGTVTGKSDFHQRRKLLKASAVAVPAIMTLRSGAAMALTSTANRCLTNPDTPINTTSDVGVNVGGIDPVLGDYEMAPPLDEWLRVTAKPGMLLMYATGNSPEKPYYLIRKDNTLYDWDSLDGWLIYNKDGEERDNLHKKADFITAWKDGKAVAFYGVDSYPDGLIFIDESSAAVAVPIFVSSYMKISTTLVYLLAYYDPLTGTITYYPMPQGEALLITGSCLSSINPAFQI